MMTGCVVSWTAWGGGVSKALRTLMSEHRGGGLMTPPPQNPVVIDGGDRACISLLLQLRARIDRLPGGTTVHLIATDPAASIDLPAWCHLTGHTYLGPVINATRPTYAMCTVSAPAATDPGSPWRRQS
jgi:tRNA 2-thiouridine synthesizing protein A